MKPNIFQQNLCFQNYILQLKKLLIQNDKEYFHGEFIKNIYYLSFLYFLYLIKFIKYISSQENNKNKYSYSYSYTLMLKMR